jgi:hypothetical protein
VLPVPVFGSIQELASGHVLGASPRLTPHRHFLRLDDHLCFRAGSSRRGLIPSQKPLFKGICTRGMIAHWFPDVVLRTTRRRVDPVGQPLVGSTRDHFRSIRYATRKCPFP